MKFLTIYATLVVLTPNDAKSHYSSKFGADRNLNKGVIDMDSLMETHCSPCQMNEMTKEACAGLSPMKSKPQHKPKTLSRYFESVLLPESGTGERIFGSLRAPPEASSTENSVSEISSSEPNTIPPVLRKLFLDHRSKVSKRSFVSNASVLHRWRKSQRTREKPSSSWADQSISPCFGNNVLAPKIIPPLLQSLEKSTLLLPSCKRSASTTNASEEQPKVAGKQFVEVRRDQEGLKWEEWNSIRRPNKVLKREASRRMKISDIWNKPKKEFSNHEEPVKIVLPLLLSDMKEPRDIKKPLMLFMPKVPGKVGLHNPMSGTTPSSAENLAMRNFKVKGEGGKEFSFSASISDVQQLLGLLAKPDSTLMLEKVSPERGKAEKFEKGPTPSPTSKSAAQVTPKLVEKDWLAGCSESSDGPEMKEIETDILESVVQVDIPCNKTTSASKCSDCESVPSTTEDSFDSK